MKSIGEITPNFDALEALFEAVMTGLSTSSLKLAIWWIEDFDLSPFDCQPIGAASPFADSSSTLAGSGFLIQSQPANFGDLISTLSDHLTYKLLHLEIEVAGIVQFAAYDHFGCVFFGNQLSLDLLETLKASGVICNYHIYDDAI